MQLSACWVHDENSEHELLTDMSSIAVSGVVPRITTWMWVWSVAGAVLALLSVNPLLTLSAVLLVPVFFLLLWRPGEPPILLFALGYQWSQVTAKIFNANVLGVPVSDLFVSNAIETAIWYSMAGMIALALGMRVPLGRREHTAIDRIRSDGSRYNVVRVWYAYLFSFGMASVLQVLAFELPGMTQPLLMLAEIKFFFLWAFIYLVLVKQRGYGALVVVIVLESVAGFLGYFAEFKDVFFLVLIAYLTARPFFKKRDFVNLALVSVVLIFLSLFWTSIKGDYRDFLSRGTSQQIIAVEVPDRFNWVARAAARTDAGVLAESVAEFAERVAYVDFFAYTILRVPALLPHAEGDLWWGAIRHIFMPRLLFPDKPVLGSDSELTMKYTGLYLASDQEGTSISIGYMGESYVDYGFPKMLWPVLALGFLWGLMYRVLLRISRWPLMNYAACVYVLIHVNQFEIHIVKLLGGTVMTFLVAILWMKLVVPFMRPLLLSSSQKRESVA